MSGLPPVSNTGKNIEGLKEAHKKVDKVGLAVASLFALAGLGTGIGLFLHGCTPALFMGAPIVAVGGGATLCWAGSVVARNYYEHKLSNSS